MSTDWHSLPPDAPPETHIALLDARSRDLARMLREHKTDLELHLKISAEQRDLMLKAIDRERWFRMATKSVGWTVAMLVAVAGAIGAFEKIKAVWPW